MSAAVRVEALKMLRSPVGAITAVTLVLGLCGLLIVITFGASSGQPQLMAKLGPAAAPDWAGLMAGAEQVVSVASLLACGVVVAWLFGREFADGTIVGLFALPVGRAPIAVAKLLVFLAWAVLVGLLLSVCVAVLGLVFGYGMPDSAVGESLLRLWLLTVLSGLLVIPVAWVATLTRSLLAAIGCTIGLVVIAQISALAGLDGWMPIAAPALWAIGSDPTVTGVQLLLVPVFGLVFAGLTVLAWARLQLRR
ncbi:ABC transporter permease [Brevibacterium sp. S111]|jgi:ABC-2 type transport system permease protein|uniref:ABC transporter permease n=1 Tax=Brevibacterium sp. S111 TaxID=2483795 RepID=UPI001081C1CC|nr:ABC transporter permease [Brevibacterium sp. S111]TGD08609.1 ABC transporter permease [Brevibacterium sp. S111]